MKVRWIAKPVTVGPRHIVAISTGDVRVVHAVQNLGKRLMLQGDNGVGYFGWVELSDVEAADEEALKTIPGIKDGTQLKCCVCGDSMKPDECVKDSEGRIACIDCASEDPNEPPIHDKLW